MNTCKPDAQPDEGAVAPQDRCAVSFHGPPSTELHGAGRKPASPEGLFAKHDVCSQYKHSPRKGKSVFLVDTTKKNNLKCAGKPTLSKYDIYYFQRPLKIVIVSSHR